MQMLRSLSLHMEMEFGIVYTNAPPMSHVQSSTLQKTTKHSCATRIITTSIGVPPPTYLGLWYQFPSAHVKMHKF
jgi:hypothetical protein